MHRMCFRRVFSPCMGRVCIALAPCFLALHGSASRPKDLQYVSLACTRAGDRVGEPPEIFTQNGCMYIWMYVHGCIYMNWMYVHMDVCTYLLCFAMLCLLCFACLTLLASLCLLCLLFMLCWLASFYLTVLYCSFRYLQAK